MTGERGLLRPSAADIVVSYDVFFSREREVLNLKIGWRVQESRMVMVEQILNLGLWLWHNFGMASARYCTISTKGSHT